MFEKQLPARPALKSFEQQAEDLMRAFTPGNMAARARVSRQHPVLYKALPDALTLSDARLVVAREHGFLDWAKLAAYVTVLEQLDTGSAMSDAAESFLEVALLPRHADHTSGTLQEAQQILARHPEVATANIYTAAVLGDEGTVRRLIAEDARRATALGGPHGWDALTHLCFSRFLQHDGLREEAFERTAQALLDAGADATTGWWETIDWPKDRAIFESALYAAAAVARRPGLTRLLLERGADPNDEETPYHVPESYDNAILKVLLQSGRPNPDSLTSVLLRKTDWHDEAGIQMVLEHGADPNRLTRWGDSAMQHALRRDNSDGIVRRLLQHNADPVLRSSRDQRSAWQIAAWRGRADALRLFAESGFKTPLTGLDALVEACALGDEAQAESLVAADATLPVQLKTQGGALLAEFAGNGNTAGLRVLQALGIAVNALYLAGDGYFAIASNSTALHVAAWRARPECMRWLLQAGAEVNAKDGWGRTALQLAVQAAVDSHWMNRRTPDSIEALLEAGASQEGIALPTGYPEADALLRRMGHAPLA